MPKESVKDKLQGNEIDLSLSDLTSVPVKELAAVPKGTSLDLSCNLLSTLTPEFCSLKHLVKLDLSKNHITDLPANFGNLNKLQHLDLYSNRLVTLPISFFHLKNLKWLDMKDNPLEPALQAVAGDCLSEVECKNCAKNVVAYMRSVQSDAERQKQKQLKEKREAEALLRKEEEIVRQRKKAEKLAEKERRRKEYEARMAAERDQEERDVAEEETSMNSSTEKADGLSVSAPAKKSSTGGLSCCGVFLVVVMGLVAVFVGLYFYCESHSTDAACVQGRNTVLIYYRMAKDTVENFTKPT